MKSTPSTSHPTPHQIEDEAPVYDVLDEDQYEELVRTRRQREDFVVDDGMRRLSFVFSVKGGGGKCLC